MTITGVGGVAVVLCVGGGNQAMITLATAEPAIPLFIIKDFDYGPASVVHVTFDNTQHTTTITATCGGGLVQPQVQES